MAYTPVELCRPYFWLQLVVSMIPKRLDNYISNKYNKSINDTNIIGALS